MYKQKNATKVSVEREVKSSYAGLSDDGKKNVRTYVGKVIANQPDTNQEAILGICAELQNKCVGMSAIGALELVGKLSEFLQNPKTVPA